MKNFIIGSLIICTFISTIISCNGDHKNESPTPIVSSNNYSSKKLSVEENDVLEYLKSNGFVVISKNEATKLKKIQKIRTLNQAKELMNMVNEFKREKSIQTKSERQNNKNERLGLIPCEDAGLHRIINAIDAGISGVTVTFNRDSQGNINNVTSIAEGLRIAWDWSQREVFFINQKREFCIDGQLKFGVDLMGIPLFYDAPTSIRIKIFDDCVVQVYSYFGYCR